MLHFAGGRSKHFRYLYSFSAQPRTPFWHKNQHCHPKTGPLSQILVTRGHPSFRSLASQEIALWVSDLATALPHFFSLSSQVSISASWVENSEGLLDAVVLGSEHRKNQGEMRRILQLVVTQVLRSLFLLAVAAVVPANKSQPGFTMDKGCLCSAC